MSLIVRSLNVPRAPAGALRLAPADGPIEVGPRGFAADGDEHALGHAFYAYPTLHHAVWRTMRAQAQVAPADAPLPPASFDEHLALEGVVEAQLWLGDVLRFPGCALVVGEPRQPDARFDETLGFAQASKMVAQSRWCGFWLGVRAPGVLAAGDPFELIPGPRATGVVELFRARLEGRRR